MIEATKEVIITPSCDLAEMHLGGIVGRKGVVTEQIFNTAGRLIGYMVLLDKSFQGEYLWFVPEDAVHDEEESQ